MTEREQSALLARNYDRNWRMFDALTGDHPMLADIRELDWYPPHPKRRPRVKNIVPWFTHTLVVGAIIAAVCFAIVIMKGG